MREEKRSERIHDAFNYLDEEMIEEVDALRGNQVPVKEKESQMRKNPWSWQKWTRLVAGICVLVLAGSVWYGIGNAGNFENTNSGQPEMLPSDKESSIESNDIESNDIENDMPDKPDDTDSVVDGDETVNQEQSAQAVMLPAYSVNLKKEEFVVSDMALFFIYEGRCYVQTCDYMSKNVVGKYVCTTTGLVDEWTKEDGYVELAGSFEADIYTVKGADPEFMLCTVYEDGVVETFVHNNDIVIKRGGEILEWLGFEVGMEEYESFCNKGNSCTTEVSEEAGEILDKFFANFADSEAILRKDISVTTDEEDIYHLVIVTENGVPLHFELLNGGYVSYYGLNNVCVKIDERVYQLVIDVLENK